MIVKVNQDMLDNDANLQDANEDIVDEKIPETEDQPKQEMTQSQPSTDAVEFENTEDQQGENTTSEDSNLDEDELSVVKSEEENYDDLNLEQLLKALDKKVSSGKIHHHKRDVEALSKQIEPKLSQIFENKKEDFINAGGELKDFDAKIPEKTIYNELIRRYKSERARYYQELEKSFQNNLVVRKNLIEELKGLIGIDQPISETYKQFKNLQSRWRESGHVPRAEANNIWKTYHHHVGIFYDFLHLNREFRELDFKYNYEEKLKIIEQAEALSKMDNIQKAFRDLQELHKRWKDELGPIAKEHGETLWERFSEATKVIHEKRQFFQKNQTEVYRANYEKKKTIISQMQQLAEVEIKTHNEMQKMIRDMESLRTSFFECGHVSRSDNAEIWAMFKDVMRLFSKKRNTFYKSLKKEYSENFKQRMELVKQVEAFLQTEDFAATTPKVIALQRKWKEMGAVSRKQNDKTWKLFRKACNDYFALLDERKNKLSEVEQQAFEEKDELLKKLQSKEGLDRTSIDHLIEEWTKIGSVGRKTNQINSEFVAAIENSLKQLGEDKESIASFKYELKIKLMGDRTELIQKERSQIKQRLDKAKQEYIQLETNMEFFAKSSSENPVVNKVMKDLEKQKKIIDGLQQKLDAFKRM
ncbi:MAG: chromosome segregation protein [Flavobacteriaceae bacterium]|nr:chromosome segregation protein [Flavobacteriaceae bacterium]